jgi:hypothetical protein
LAATIAVQHLGILEPWAVAAKTTILIAYGLLAYLLLLSSLLARKGAK